MSDDNDSGGFLDSFFMRIIAGIVIVICVGLLAYLNRDQLVDKPVAEESGLNPEFAECRDERVGQVEKMFNEGVIQQDKFELFKKRAIDTCAGQFPPDK